MSAFARLSLSRLHIYIYFCLNRIQPVKKKKILLYQLVHR